MHTSHCQLIGAMAARRMIIVAVVDHLINACILSMSGRIANEHCECDGMVGL